MKPDGSGCCAMYAVYPVRSAVLAITMTVGFATSAAGDPIRGVVRVHNQASLSTDVPMRLVRLPFREGHAFRAGDVIAAFDCRRIEAERQAVRGALREAELNLDANIKLDTYKAVGRHEIEVARARVEKAKGEHRMVETRLEDCVVRAPFAGRVADAPVRVWEFTVAQRPYLSIVEDGNFEIEFIVPSRALASMTIGREIHFTIDEIPGGNGRAEITAINPTVDPVSKTLRIVTRVLSAPDRLTVGMSCLGEPVAAER